MCLAIDKKHKLAIQTQTQTQIVIVAKTMTKNSHPVSMVTAVAMCWKLKMLIAYLHGRYIVAVKFHWNWGISEVSCEKWNNNYQKRTEME